MLTTLAIANYRSLLDLVIPLAPLNVVTGPNGSGKSNLYRSLRLLAEAGHDGVVNALAREGGLQSTFWAGPVIAGSNIADLIHGAAECFGGLVGEVFECIRGVLSRTLFTATIEC